MGGKRFFMGILALVCSMTVGAAAWADRTDKLIELLISKGIITSEEAGVLEQELAQDAPPAEAGGTKSAEAAPAGQAPAADWTRKIEVKYDKGVVVRTTDDRFSMKWNGGIQPYFLYADLEGRENTNSLGLRRARLLVSGNALYPWLKYGTQLTLENFSTGVLRDYYIEATYYDWFRPKVGQFKVPFDREFLAGGFDLQLATRSIANAQFGLFRDIGLQLSGSNDHVEYRLGLFNGSGANRSNVDEDLMYTGRVVVTPFGKPYSYSQAALDHPESPQLALGLAGGYLPGLEPGERQWLAGVLGNRETVTVESDVFQWAADLAFKYLGFSLEAGYYYRDIDPLATTSFGGQDANGYYLQAGCFLIPRHLELAGRYAFVDPDNPEFVGDNDQEEYTLGASYYFDGHNLKTQFQYTYLTEETDTGDQDDHLFYLTMALKF